MATQRGYGRRSYVTAALYTGRSDSGTSAGVAILPKAHLYTYPNDGSLLQQVTGVDDYRFSRWVPMTMKLRHVDVTVITLYLFTAAGVSERN